MKHITDSLLDKFEEHRKDIESIPLPFKPFDPEKYRDEPGEFTLSITYTNPHSKT